MRFTKKTIKILKELDCYIDLGELMLEIKEDICVNGSNEGIEIKILDRNTNRTKLAFFNVSRGGWVKLYDIRSRFGK